MHAYVVAATSEVAIAGAEVMVEAEGVSVGVTSVNPVPEEIQTTPPGYECAGLHAYVVAAPSVPTVIDPAAVGACTWPSAICVMGAAAVPAEACAEVAVAAEAAGTEVTGDELAVGVTSVNPVPEETQTTPPG